MQLLPVTTSIKRSTELSPLTFASSPFISMVILVLGVHKWQKMLGINTLALLVLARAYYLFHLLGGLALEYIIDILLHE
jgi:hypothetical protein